MTSSKWLKKYDIDWKIVLETCDYNGDGVIDFQEFASATIDRQVLRNKEDIKKIFTLLDVDGDGTLSIHDFEKLFNSYNGAKMDLSVWN